MLRHLLPLEKLDTETMASGNLSLRLTTSVDPALFGIYARCVMWVLGGRVLTRADSPFERVWDVVVDGQAYWLCFNDWGPDRPHVREARTCGVTRFDVGSGHALTT